MIGTGLMLPRGSYFSCNSILDEIGDDVYSDIYDEEIFVINHLLICILNVDALCMS